MHSNMNDNNGMPDDPNGMEEVNFVIRDLQYSSVLDVPFYTRMLHSLYSYFAKINASITTPPLLGYVYFIIVTIQSFFPAFLLDCEDLWPSDSLMAMILNILSYLYQGPHASIKSARVYVGFVFALIFIVLFILLIVRARVYQKTGRVTVAETKFMLYTFKYVLPLLCPHILAGVGVSFDQIINKDQIDINIVTIIFGIDAVSTQLFFTYAIITPRVLLEDTLTHEWLPFIAFTSISNSSVMALVSTIAGAVNGKNRAGCSIWMFLQSVCCGLAVFYLNGYVKMIINVIVSATACAAAVVSIIMTADFFLTDHLAPEIVFVIGILVFIAFVVGFKFLKQMMVTRTMQLFDSLMDNRSTAGELMESHFKNPFTFLGEIRSVMELWHPYLLTFELFDYAINKWPKSLEIQILYARILAFFPNKNTQMMWITSLIAKCEDRKSPTSYLLQLRHISRTRQTSLTMAIQKQLDDINSKKEVLMIFLRRFWENILQRNIANFWNEAAKVHKHISELDAIMAQLIDNYPHNAYVVEAYYNFVENIKYDKVEAREVLKQLDQLKNNRKAKTDIALDLAVKVFPTLSSYAQTIDADMPVNDRPTSVSLLIPPENNENNIESDPNRPKSSSGEKNSDSDSDTETQINTALNGLTKHSPLGSIWIGCLIVILMTGLTIGLFYYLYDTFVSGFLDQQEIAIDFLQEIDLTIYELNRLTININIYPMVLTEDVSENLYDLFADQSRFVEMIAPKLWAAGDVPPLTITKEVLLDGIKSIKERFTQMISALSILPQNDPYVQQITTLFTVPIPPSTLSTKDMGNQMLIDSQECISYNNPDQYYSSVAFYRMKNCYLGVYLQFTAMSAVANLYASVNFDDNMVDIDEIMVLVILVTLLLVTLPFVVQTYIHYIQSDAIAQSFTLFPNTEIRSVINRFGKSTTDMDEDLSQVASLSQISSGADMNTVIFMLSFFSSFIVVIICAFIVYYAGQDFVNNAGKISNDIYTLYPAFSALSTSFNQGIRIFMSSHEKWNYVRNKTAESLHLPDPSIIDGLPQLQALVVLNLMNGSFNRYLAPDENFTEILEQAIQMCGMALMNFSTGMWSSETSGISCLFADNGQSFDLFKDAYPLNPFQPAYNKSYFERLATLPLTEALDLCIGYLFSYMYKISSLLTAAFNNPATVDSSLYDKLFENDAQMQALTYWFSNFTDYNRSQPYFDLVNVQVRERIQTYEDEVKICLIVVIVWQILACVFLLLYMYQDHLKIKRALRFYYYLNPTVVMSNKNAMSLLETGHPLSQDESGVTVANSEFIMSQISQGIVFIDRELIIQNYNNAFSTTFQTNEARNTSLVDICQAETNDRSWLNFIQLLHEIIVGKQPPQYSGNIIAHLKNGQVQHLHANVISLIGNQTANEGEQDAIDKIAIIFDDCTDIYMRQQMISQEEEHITAMLANVMPARVVHDFEAGGDTLSFVVQMVTIGQIRVTTTKQFDENTDEAFLFYNDIFTRFDQEIKSFELLTKVRTFAHTYTYVGGLFSEVNKPERHAEEAIRFILALLKLEPELSEKYGAEIHFTSGVHTGGPIVAGVMSLTKPSFQIIGAAMEMATQMKSKGVEDQIHITRAVYELIFSSGFNVQERGDTEIRGGKIIPTYLVRLH